MFIRKNVLGLFVASFGVFLSVPLFATDAFAGLGVEPMPNYTECTPSSDEIREMFGELYVCPMEYCIRWDDDGRVSEFMRVSDICELLNPPKPSYNPYELFADTCIDGDCIDG